MSKRQFRRVIRPCLLLACLAAVPSAALAEEKPVSPRTQWKNIAAGKPVKFATTPDYPETSDADDALQLTNGKVTDANPIWYDKATVGWVGPKTLEWTIDLGSVQPIRGVALRSAAGKSGVGWPAQVNVSVSDDGEAFAPAIDLMKGRPASASAYKTDWLENTAMKTHGRYVRVRVKPTDTGAGCFFFADEMEVYRGDDAWLATPLSIERPAGEESPRPQMTNLAAGRPVTLVTPANSPDTSDADDAKQLVDGKLSPAQPLWGDKRAIGWMAVDPTMFTIDLGADQPVAGVALRLGGGSAGVEWPASISVQVSTDGKKFAPITDLARSALKAPPTAGYAAHWFVIDTLRTHGRFVKFVISPATRGNGTYVFADEVEVYRGQDAWLKEALVMSASPEQWTANWSEMKWRDQTVADSERPTRLNLVDDPKPKNENPLTSAEVKNGAVTFSLIGEASKPRSAAWAADLPKPVSTEKCRWAVVRFRAEGIRRTYDVRPLFTLKGYNDQSGAGKVELLEANLVPNDDRSHTLITQLPEGFTAQQIQAAVTTESDTAKLTIESLELRSAAPQQFGLAVQAAGTANAGTFVSADLSKSANGTFEKWFDAASTKHTRIMNGVRAMKAGRQVIDGVPFTIGSGGSSIALMPASTATDAEVDFLGHKVARKYLEPESRNDSLAIDVDVQAREAFLLMGVSAPAIQRRGGQTWAPLRLDDPECIVVELSYDSGEPEIAFPYSLADEACVVPARLWGTYAVAVDPKRRLKQVTLRSRQFGPAFALAGLTFNTGATPVVKSLAEIKTPEVTKQNADPADRPVNVARQGSVLTVGNRWYTFAFDVADGLSIKQFVNQWNEAAPVMLGRETGLQVRVGDTVYTGASFNASIVSTGQNSAEFRLVSRRAELPLRIDLTLTADGTPALGFDARVTNTGKAPLAVELTLPALAGASIGDVANSRLMFPQYRAVDTGETISLRAPYGPEFASQFMTVYNRKAGVGFSIRTDNPTQRMADFVLAKDAGGIRGGVAFPAGYNTLVPGETRAMPRVSIVSHNGDWHAAFASYRDWVKTWYKPFKSQDKSFFQKAWEIACYRTSDIISWNDSRVPPFITKDRKKFVTDEVFAFEKEKHGHVPDLAHFFNWTHNDTKKQNEYGAFGTDLAYAQVGGIDVFRDGIAHMQQKWNVPLSLYAILDRLRISAVPKEVADAVIKETWHQDMDNDASAKVRASGAVDGVVYPKVGNDVWLNYIVGDIAKMQKDTACKLVYIDVLPYFSHLASYNGVSPRDADMKVARKLRESLPDDVVFWTEYAFTDVASQLADGSLHYYFLELCEVFARRYNQSDRRADTFAEMPVNLNRFVLTGYKTFGLPVYIEGSNKPSQPDALLMNGEAIQEDTWRLHHSRIRERLNRGYDIKHAYADCFSSDRPMPQIPTLIEGIVANEFPGKNRTLWTLFNGRPKTCGEAMISVRHVDGAIYRDIWGGKTLQPTIENGMAKIAVTLHPQQVGCVVQELPSSN